MRSLALAAPWIHDREVYDSFYGRAESVNAKLARSHDARAEYERSGEVQYVKSSAVRTRTQARRVTVPTYLIHSLDAAIPEGARRFHAALPAPKRMLWIEGDQFDFYDGEANVREAADGAAVHLLSTL